MHAEWPPTEAAILAVAPSLRLTAGVDPLMSPTARHSADFGMVVVDGRLFVRGPRRGGLIQNAAAWRRGRIRTGTIDRAVTFSLYEGPGEAIDAAYRAKYGNHGGRTTHPRAQEVTLRIEPRDDY